MKGATWVMLTWSAMLLGLGICFVWPYVASSLRSWRDDPERLRKKFQGILSIPAFADTIRKSFQNQTVGMTAILTSGEGIGEYKEECGTCALIAEGSTMPYSDNTCPQCGADTTQLTEGEQNPC